MISALVGGGALILTVVGILFKVNHDFCKDNRDNIEKTVERFHILDKKLDILIAAMEVRTPRILKRAEDLVNHRNSQKDDDEV